MKLHPPKDREFVLRFCQQAAARRPGSSETRDRAQKGIDVMQSMCCARLSAVRRAGKAGDASPSHTLLTHTGEANPSIPHQSSLARFPPVQSFARPPRHQTRPPGLLSICPPALHHFPRAINCRKPFALPVAKLPSSNTLSLASPAHV